MRTFIVRAILTVFLATVTGAFAQSAKDDIKQAGKDTKDAAKDTGMP